MNNKELNFGINFNINKQNLNDLKHSLDQIVAKAQQFENAAPDFAAPYQEAATAAKDLKSILDSSWNSKLNQLDFSKIERQLINSYGSIKDFKNSLGQIGPEAQRAFGLFNSAILNTQAPLKQTNQLLDKMAVTMSNTIRFGISSSIFNNLTSSVSKAYNYAVKLDKSLNDIRVVSGQSAEQMDRFARKANEAAKSLGSTTLDYADAALIYYQQGLGDEEIAKRTETTIKMSNALGRSAEEVSNYMTSIWNNFADGSHSLEYYADVITALGAATASSAEEIAGGLEKFAAIGETVGLSYEYATAALTTITATTRQSEDVVGTALKTLFARIQDLELGKTLEDGTSLGSYSEALQAIGVSIKDQNGDLKKMDEILNELGSKWSKMSDDQQVALAQTVAGTRQYTQLVALMENWDFFKTNVSTAQNATGTLDRQQEIYLDSVKAHMEQLEASWEGLYDTIFDEDLIKDFADILSTLVDGVQTFVQGWGGGLNNLIYPISLLGGALSTHLAENFVRVKDNAEAAKKQIENLEVQQRLIEDLTSVGSVNQMQTDGIEKVLKEQEIVQKLAVSKRHLTVEDQEQLAYLDKQLSTLNQQAQVYDILVQKTKGLGDEKTESKTVQDEYQQMREQLIQQVEQNNQVLEKLNSLSDQKSINNRTKPVLINALNFAKQELNSLYELEEQFDNLEKKQGSLTSAQTKAKKAVEGTITAREREIQVLDDLVNKQAKLGDVDRNEIANAIQNQNSKLIETSNLYTRVIDELKKYKTISKETFQEILNDLTNQKQSLESYRETLATQSERIEAQAAQIRSLFTIASSLSTIFGSIKTAADPDLTPWEKWKSITSVVAMQVLNISQSYGKIIEQLPHIAALTLKNMTADQAALMMKQGQTGQLMLQVGLQSTLNALQTTFNVLLGIAKAIMGNWVTLALSIVAAIAGIVIAYDKWFSKEAKLNKELERTKKAVQETQQAYQELSNTVSSYKDAYNGIKGLTEGTLEFYEAVVKSNEEAQKLIEQLNLIAGKDYTIDANGMITINEDNLTKALENSMKKVYASQAAHYAVQAGKIRGDENSGIEKVLTDFTRDVNKRIIEQGQNWSITKEDAERVLQGRDTKIVEAVTSETKKNTAATKESQKNIENAVDAMDDKTTDLAVDIETEMAKYSSAYKSLAQQEAELRKAQTIANIKAYASPETLVAHENAPMFTQISAQNFVDSNTPGDESWPFSQKWKDPKANQNWETGLSFSTGLMAALGFVFWPAWIAAAASAGGAYMNHRAGEKIVNAQNTIKGEYAKNLMGYEKDPTTGLWHSVIDPTDVRTEEDLFSQITEEDIKNAGTSKAIYTKKAMDIYYKQYGQVKDKALAGKSGANASDKTYKFTEEDAEYIATGYMAAISGQDFDVSVLDDEQKKFLREVLGSVSFFDEKINKWKDEMDKKLEAGLDPTNPDYNKYKYNERAKEAANTAEYNNELSNQAERLDTTTKALELYGRTMKEVINSTDKLTRKTARLIAQEYQFNKAYNEGVSTFEDLGDAYDEYLKSVRSEGEYNVDYTVTDRMAQLWEDLEKILGYDVSPDILNSQEKWVKQLFSGTEKEAEEAYQKLLEFAKDQQWDEIGNKIIENAEYVATVSGEDLQVSIAEWERLRDVIKDLKPDELMSEDDVNSLRTHIAAAKMTYEELQTFLDENKLEITTTVGDQPKFKPVDIPETTVTKIHTISGEANPYTGKAFKEGETLTWTETETTMASTYWTLADDVGIKGGSGSNTKKPTNFKKTAPSGGGSKPQKQDPYDLKPDRYHDVNVELAKIENNLKEVQEKTDRNIGSAWIENLTRQFELLNDEISMTKEKIKIAEGELSELQDKLSKQGVKFAEDGSIANYFEIFAKKEKELEAKRQKYNSYTNSDAQSEYKEVLDKEKEDFDKFVEDMERVDELITNFIPDLRANIQDALDEQTELKIKAFTHEITVRLEVAEAKRDWNEFKTRIIDGIEEDDILGNAVAKLENFETFFNETETGTIQRLSSRVAKMVDELAQFDELGNMEVYNDYHAQAIEDLKKRSDELQAEMEALYELTEEIKQSYLDMMDEAQEKFEEQLATYQQIDALIEHDMNLISLVYGDTAYAELAGFYNQQHKNNMAQLDFQKQQVDIWAEQMSMLEEGSDAWEKAKENWMAAVSDWTATIEQSIESIQNRFINALDLVFENLNRSLTNGAGLGYLEQEWDLVNKNADRYLDTINGIYEVQKLENKYQEAIDNNDGLRSQQKLKNIMDEELKALREKDKLTQYDIDRAELRYQIALKQIALEEAQQNKTKMRLRRDSQGNYTYQYTADENAISKVQNELSDLYQQLYNLDAGEYKNNLNELYTVWNEFQQAMKEAALINDPEDRAARELLVQEQYGKLINDIISQNELLKNNIYESTMSSLADLYNSNEINFQNMTEGQQRVLEEFINSETDMTNTAYNNLFGLYDQNLVSFREMTGEQKDILVNEMLPQWNTTLQAMIDKMVDEGGFEAVCKEAFEAITLAINEYDLALKEIETTSGKSFEAIKNGTDQTITATQELVQENETLINSYKDQLAAIQDVIDKMQALIDKYGAAKKAAEDYLITAQKVWETLKEKDADETQDQIISDDRPEDEKPSLPEPEPEPVTPPQPSLSIGSYIDVKSGTKWYANSYGGGAWGYATGGKILYTSSNPYGYNIDGKGWIRKSDIVGYDTGGYTGAWNSANGKLAFLHQKELVLNAQDTLNMLNAIKIVRAITDNLGASLLNRLGAISANAGAGILASADALEQNVHIDAQFPNVTNANEIESALNNLVNMASQHIQKNR